MAPVIKIVLLAGFISLVRSAVGDGFAHTIDLSDSVPQGEPNPPLLRG
jgi:hypothetical protein